MLLELRCEDRGRADQPRARVETINDAGPEAANAIKTLYAGKTIVDVPVKIAIIARGVMDGRNPMNPTDMLGMSPTVPIATIRRKSTREGSLDFEGHEELLDQFRENNFFAELKVSELS